MKDDTYMCCVCCSLFSMNSVKPRKHITITEKKLSHLLNICICKNKWFYAAAVFYITMSEKLIILPVCFRHLCLKQNNNYFYKITCIIFLCINKHRYINMQWFRKNMGIFFWYILLLISKAKNSDWLPHIFIEGSEINWNSVIDNGQSRLSFCPNKT